MAHRVIKTATEKGFTYVAHFEDGTEQVIRKNSKLDKNVAQVYRNDDGTFFALLEARPGSTNRYIKNLHVATVTI